MHALCSQTPDYLNYPYSMCNTTIHTARASLRAKAKTLHSGQWLWRFAKLQKSGSCLGKTSFNRCTPDCGADYLRLHCRFPVSHFAHGNLRASRGVKLFLFSQSKSCLRRSKTNTNVVLFVFVLRRSIHRNI